MMAVVLFLRCTTALLQYYFFEEIENYKDHFAVIFRMRLFCFITSDTWNDKDLENIRGDANDYQTIPIRFGENYSK
jgi:4-hydroxybenzoate polyprenyltransferase